MGPCPNAPTARQAGGQSAMHPGTPPPPAPGRPHARLVRVLAAVAAVLALAPAPAHAQDDDAARTRAVLGALLPQPDAYLRATVLKPAIPLEAGALVPGLAVRLQPIAFEGLGRGCEQCHRLAGPVPAGGAVPEPVFGRAGAPSGVPTPLPPGFRRLTDDPGREEAPRWSPDGTSVLVESTAPQGGGTALVSVPLGGGAPLVLASGGTWGWAEWAPDGRSLVAWRADDAGGGSSLWLLRADGSGATRLAADAAAVAFPVWSPDGAAIAFSARGPAERWSLRLLTMADGSSRVISGAAQELASRPQFSPDGRDLAYQAHEDDGFALWRARFPAGAAGEVDYAAAPRLLPTSSLPPLDLGQAPGNGVWSPDGSRIAVQLPVSDVAPGGERILSYKTWLLDPDGRHPLLLVPDGTLAERSPSWSPTGRWIAQWVWGDDLRAAVWIVSPDGRRAVDVTAGLGMDALYPAWSPDGTRLALSAGTDGAFDVLVVDLARVVPGFVP